MDGEIVDSDMDILDLLKQIKYFFFLVWVNFRKQTALDLHRKMAASVVAKVGGNSCYPATRILKTFFMRTPTYCLFRLFLLTETITHMIVLIKKFVLVCLTEEWTRWVR